MKGLIYTIISVLIVASVVAILLTYLNISYSLRKDAAEKIISDQLHYFAKNIEEDIERALRISAKRALIAAVDNVTLGGKPFEQGKAIEKIFELAQNGTLEGSRNDIMYNNSITYWMEEIEKKANKTFKFKLNTSEIEIKPFDSFNILFRINFTINISDNTETIRIYRNGQKEVLISIEGLEDPLAPLYTNGRYRKTIWKCPFESNHTYQDSSGNYHFENLANDAENGYFHSSLYGPSFLDRLEGRLVANYQSSMLIGLESFVNIQKLKALGIEPQPNRTVVDFLYWNSSIRSEDLSCYWINNPDVPNWFRIDNEIDDQQRLMKYQLFGNPLLNPC
ncbi:MAG: hypothetical protein QXQ69_00650 [Candidatus Aenigmatarchaeota archaeon]